MMMLQCKGVSVGYGGKAVVEQVDATFSAGRMYAVLGPNGCGKTTLLRTLAGLLPAVHGTVLLQHRRLDAYSSRDLSKKLAVVLTEKHQLEQATGYEIVSMGRYPHTGFFGRLSAQDHAIVQRYLWLCQADGLAGKCLSEMSDGEQQKIFLARGLAQETEILLLDEPTSHLDIHHKLELLQILRQVCREQQRLVITTLHEPELALKSCDHFVLMGQGRVQQQGTIDAIVQQDGLNQLYGLRPQQLDSYSGLVEFSQHSAVAVVLCGSDLHTPLLLRKLQQLGIGYCLTGVDERDLSAVTARSMGAPVQRHIDEQQLRQARLVIDYTDTVAQTASASVVRGHGLTVAALEALCQR